MNFCALFHRCFSCVHFSVEFFRALNCSNFSPTLLCLGCFRDLFYGYLFHGAFQKKFWCDVSQGFSLRPFLKVPILRFFTGVFLFIFSRGLFSVHSFAWTISMDSLAVLFSIPALVAQLFMGLSRELFPCAYLQLFSACTHSQDLLSTSFFVHSASSA